MSQKKMLVTLLKDLGGRWQEAIEDAAFQGNRLRVKVHEKDSGDVEVLLVSTVEEVSGITGGLTFETTLLTLKELETVLHYIQARDVGQTQTETARSDGQPLSL